MPGEAAGRLTPDPVRPGHARDVSLDVIRVLGLVAVIVGHVWYAEPVKSYTYSWHVPIFFILAGYLWNAERSLREDVRRRARSIVRPYVVWWVICTAFFVTWAWVVFAEIPFRLLALAVWGGAGAVRPYTAFWFFSAFLVSVLFVRVTIKRGWWVAVVGGVAALAFCELVHPLALRAPLASAAGLACSVFILVGIGLRKVRPRLRRPMVLGAVSLAAGAGMVALPPYRPLDIKVADFGTPGLAVIAAALIGVGGILLAESLVPRLRRFPRQSVIRLSHSATFVFLSHGIMLMLLRTPRHGGWIDFLLVASVPLALALATGGTRWAPWLHGAPPWQVRAGTARTRQDSPAGE